MKGVGARFYSIENVYDRSTRSLQYQFANYEQTALPSSPAARFGMAGTGDLYLAGKKDSWRRDLRSLLKAHDRGKVSADAVADRLAALSFEAPQNVSDTVGPRSIVVWRPRPDRRRACEGGAHRSYTGTARDVDIASIPSIMTGRDMTAISHALKNYVRTLPSGGLSLGDAEAQEMLRLIARLPTHPDEKLQ